MAWAQKIHSSSTCCTIRLKARLRITTSHQLSATNSRKAKNRDTKAMTCLPRVAGRPSSSKGTRRRNHSCLSTLLPLLGGRSRRPTSPRTTITFHRLIRRRCRGRTRGSCRKERVPLPLPPAHASHTSKSPSTPTRATMAGSKSSQVRNPPANRCQSKSLFARKCQKTPTEAMGTGVPGLRRM